MKSVLCFWLPIILSVIVLIYAFNAGNENTFWWMIACGALFLLIAGILWIVTMFKENKESERVNKEYDQYVKEAEEALAAEMEAVKGNSLKKELVKRRLVREYIEKNHPKASRHIDNSKFENLTSSAYAFLVSGSWLVAPLLCILLIVVTIVAMSCLLYLPYSYYVIANVVIAVLAVGMLMWKRCYMMALVAGTLASIYVFGICNAGLDGLNLASVFQTISEANGVIFRNPTHAGYTISGGILVLILTSLCMLVYPFLKKNVIYLWLVIVILLIFHLHRCDWFEMHATIVMTPWPWDIYALFCAINAELSVMMGLSFFETYMLIFVYGLSLLTVVCAAAPYIKALRNCQRQDEKTHANKAYTEKCEKQYRIRLAWLIVNIITVVLVCVHFIGMSLDDAGVMFARDSHAISNFVGCSYTLFRIIILVVPAPLSIIVSWKLRNNIKSNSK